MGTDEGEPGAVQFSAWESNNDDSSLQVDMAGLLP